MPVVIALSLVVLGFVSGCQSSPPAQADPVSLVGLRNLAEARGMDIGSEIHFRAMTIPKYQKIAASEFNTITAENEMKWGTIHSVADHYEWFFGDELVRFAKEHQMKLRGHTLVWHQQLPAWVTESAKTREAMLGLVKEHCTAIVGHYQGEIGKWDVVNEVVDDNSGMRPSIFFLLTGTEFIDVAFRAAHEADPQALLYINDYSIEDLNPKSDRLYELVKGLLAKGIPINGIGFQAHWDLDQLPSMDSVRRNIERFTALGLLVDVTELDIRIKGPASADRLKKQANAYGALMQVLLSEKGTRSLTMWGFDDGHSWIPGWKSDYGNALILDSHYRPKPAYFALAQALSQ